ncbi:Autoinducer 2 sensor kinase/phosphatase LuxQ [compost metagenome]
MASFHKPVRDREQLFNTLFHSDVVGVLITEVSGTIFEANDYFLHLLGYTREDLEKSRMSWVDLTPPEFVEVSRMAGAKLGETKSVTFEKEYLHKDGHRVPALVGVTRFTDGSVIAIVIDFSEKKKAEQALAEANAHLEERVQERTQELQRSEAFFAAVFENIPNMIFVKSAKELRFVRFNKAGEDLIGIPSEEMMGKTDYDFFPAEQADFFTSQDRKVFQEVRVLDIPDEEVKTRNGIRYLHTKKIPIMDKEGNPEYLLGISEDITEKKESERQKIALYQEQVARREAEMHSRQMALLSEMSSVLSETFDLKKVVNSFVRKITESFADVCVVDLFDEDHLEVVIMELAARDPEIEAKSVIWRKRHPLRWDSEIGAPLVIRTGVSEMGVWPDLESHLRESFSVDAAEEGVPLSISSYIITPIMSRNQPAMGSVTFIRSSPEHHYTDGDLVLAEELSRRLAISVENCRLFLKSQDASKAKTSFLANMSHEIRTPLGAMLGFAEVLSEDTSLDESQRNTLAIILRNGEQLLRIVDEILDISKVESDKMQIETVVFSLPDLVFDVMRLMRGKCDEKGIELKLSMGDVPEHIISDPTRLRQILINVIGNAIKFTDSGSIQVRVDKKKGMSLSRPSLEIQILDTGIGISAEQRQSLFQPFTQADSSTTRKYGGTGLGLFLSRKLARLLKGDVVLDSSRLGQGSCFTVTIAYEEPSAEEIDSKKRIEEPQESFEGIESVLVVDDAVDNRDLLVRHLERIGVSRDKIDVAENGDEAVSKALLKRYSLIFMDIQMPVKDGFQALYELRKKSYDGQIVALTAHAMKGDEEKCLAEGFNNYLKKPFSRGELKGVLSKARQSWSGTKDPKDLKGSPQKSNQNQK